MATYITLFRYTHQGIRTFKEGPSRLEAARKAYRSLGAELKALYLVMGQYDFVGFVEAPDDVTATKASLAVGALGAVTSETMRAFNEDEFRSIVAAVS